MFCGSCRPVVSTAWAASLIAILQLFPQLGGFGFQLL
jgi:hypothetical protein